MAFVAPVLTLLREEEPTIPSLDWSELVDSFVGSSIVGSTLNDHLWSDLISLFSVQINMYHWGEQTCFCWTKKQLHLEHFLNLQEGPKFVTSLHNNALKWVIFLLRVVFVERFNVAVCLNSCYMLADTMHRAAGRLRQWCPHISTPLTRNIQMYLKPNS